MRELEVRAEISPPVLQPPDKWPGTGMPPLQLGAPLSRCSRFSTEGKRGSVGDGEGTGRRQRGWEVRDKWWKRVARPGVSSSILWPLCTGGNGGGGA